MLDVDKIRRDFPMLQRTVHGKPLVWLDNAATTQKPQVVIDRITRYYTEENSNIHSSVHAIGHATALAFEGARATIARFLNGAGPQEVVFVRGATEGLNLLAATLGAGLKAGDEIVLTEAEHHSNILPWQVAAQKSGAVLRVAPVDDNGDIILAEYQRLLGPRTRIAAFTHVSNALGTVMPIAEMTALAKRHGATVVIDGAQAIARRRVDVQAIGCDFYVFSGHKIFAPTGIGAVWGRAELWETLPPWQTGGGTVERVSFEDATYLPPPRRFEAGTGSISGAIGLGTAIDYVNGIGMGAIDQYESEVLEHAVDGLRGVPGLRLIGNPRERGGAISFSMAHIPDAEIGKQLDEAGIAVRIGSHCAQPLLRRFGLSSTVRPSFSVYNTRAEADFLVETLKQISVKS